MQTKLKYLSKNSLINPINCQVFNAFYVKPNTTYYMKNSLYNLIYAGNFIKNIDFFSYFLIFFMWKFLTSIYITSIFSSLDTYDT